MNAYLQERRKLIDEDRAQRVDTLRTQSLSPVEQHAEEIVRKIRIAEAASVWNANGTDIFDYKPDNASPNLFPGMAFLTGIEFRINSPKGARDISVHTKLFKILSKMPKGGLLHAHLGATADARKLLEISLTQPTVHIATSGTLTPQDLQKALPEFKVLPPTYLSSLESIADKTYVKGEYVPLQKARETFPSELGGTEGFDNWIVNSLQINPAEAYGSHNTTTKVWSKFTSVSAISEVLLGFMPIWREYVREFFRSSIADGMSYVEPRVFFWHKFMTGADGLANVPHREWLIVYEGVMNDIVEELKEQGRQNALVGSKIIYTTMRFDTMKELEWHFENCIALKQEFPHLIAGFDLVGHEDTLKPLLEHVQPLLKFQERQVELGLEIPLLLHAGETLGDGTDADMNLYDAILLGTKRIGHGYSLVKHPKLMEICKTKQIALEVCPISNEVLRLTTAMPMHPLPIMMNHGIPLVLSSDDPAAWGCTGLTYDFYQVLVSSEISGLITMGELARNSLKYSCLSQQEKERALELYEKQWGDFVNWVVQEYTTDGEFKA
ncbi:Metallo-dependent hydrolase [Wolfiporia cocos MD-104 SS10]|uniref:adenosine deaminase n=1 Tax=Wolfiporia cocos (strain MD-104) TaxID=742152 RepID=A0A2H3JYA8_WOLCO|nr:Metallo-dependent hydrolase [Wolfiporia cocos MD-104 SS10]